MVRGNTTPKRKMHRGNKTPISSIHKQPHILDPVSPNNGNTPTYTPVHPPSYLPQRVMQINATPDELIFAYEWANNPKDPGKALLSSGITSPSDNPQTVNKLIREYTGNPQVVKAYQEALINKLESIAITTNRIDAHLSVMAFADKGLMKDPSGNILPLEKMPWEMRVKIQEYAETEKWSKDGEFLFKTIKVKCYDEKDAMKTLRVNKKEDRAFAMGIIPGQTGSTFNIQNNNHFIQNQNIIGNQLNYNSEVKNTIDIKNVTTDELKIILKLMGSGMDTKAIEAENLVEQFRPESESNYV